MERGSPSGQTARLLMAIVLVGLGLWFPAPAVAADPEPRISVNIDGMSPAVPQRDGTIRLSGTVRNTSDTNLTRLRAVLWRSLDPIQDREGLEAALASRADEPLGARVKPQTIYENLPSDDDQTLAADESAEFDLTADVEDLELPDEDGVYLVGVQVRGGVEEGDDEILGRGRIFMPLVTTDDLGTDPGTDPGTDEAADAGQDRAQQRLTSVVLLSSRPSLVRAGVLADDHLAREIAGGGRLRALLQAAGRPGVTYAVDPATVEELETMRRGYQVLGSDGALAAGTQSVLAARWLDDFARIRTRADGYRTLYGSPDLTALIHADQQQIIREAKAAGDQVETTRSLPLLVLPGAGRADGDTMAVAGTLGARAVLVSENTARGETPLLRVGNATPVVSYSATALSGGPGPAPRQTAVKIRQRALADSWLAAAASSVDEPAQQVRLISAVDQVGAVPTAATPFLLPRTLTNLLVETPTAFDGDFAYGRKARNAELTDDQLGDLAGLREDLTTYADLFVDPTRAEAQRRAVLPRAASSLWRNREEDFDRYVELLDADVTTAVKDRISIVVTPRVQTTGRAGAFPITVRNNLPVSETDPELNAIRVELRFSSVNSQRLTVAPIRIDDLPAGRSQTKNAQVEAETNGAVEVTAALFTVTGRPLGESEPILVNATQAGTIGWIIAIVAGVVLVGTTALRIRQVAKERSGDADADPSDPGTDTTPAPLVVSRPPVEETEAPPPTPAAKDRDPLDV